MDLYRIGDVSRLTGLSVTTLRYYEQHGLVTPSGRLDGGHRVYSRDDVTRLYRVCVLRRLGQPVAAIPALLAESDGDLTSTLDAHLAHLDAQLVTLGRERERVLAARRTVSSETLADPEILALLDGVGDADLAALRRITLLVYDDLEAAHDFLVAVFGFGPGELHRDAAGAVVHATVHVGDGVVWLHRVVPEFGLVSPALGMSTHCMAVMVEDVDRHCAQTRAAGASIVYGPRDQPYGYREYAARDCEGGLWSFMQPLDEPTTRETTTHEATTHKTVIRGEQR